MHELTFIDRDLSWISFNYRVLLEAKNPKVPLLERLRFIAIYSSNLDEFFRVRVAAIRSIREIDKKKINESAGVGKDLLKEIHSTISGQLDEYGQTLRAILSELNGKGIFIPDSLDQLSSQHKLEVSHYFKTKVLAYLRPYIFDRSTASPFLNNQQLYLAMRLQKDGEECFGYVNIPSDQLPRYYHIQDNDNHYFLYLDDIVRDNIGLVFPGFEVLECKSVKLNKDADLHIDDEFSGDLVEKIEKQIKKRNLGTPSRFLYDRSMSEDLIDFFTDTFELAESDLVAGGRYHNLNDLFGIFNPTRHKLEYDRQQPITHAAIERSNSLLKCLEAQDCLLHFPYQSYDYVLQFFNEAAVDPDVKEIYVTFYRMAGESVIGEALISAANNGKKVIVFMELKARFDEENNLRWASRLKEAGVKIIYSIPGLKVHAKVALVRKKKISYGFFGTGNLNEKTAKIYCDHGLLSTNKDLTAELFQVFRFLHKRKSPDPFKHLIVSQFNAIDKFSALIDREIKNQKKGKSARIVIKLNNLEEKQMIAKLYEAAEAGVDVELLVRSICCLVPETSGIRVTRIVDRYLEHARVFHFWNDGNEEVYLGSSDWMTRNLHRRVEVCFPIFDKKLKEEILAILKLQLQDNSNAVLLDPEMKNVAIRNDHSLVNAQHDTYAMVKGIHEDQ